MVDATRARQLVEIQSAFTQIADGLEADLKKLPHVPRHGRSAARYERGQVVADAKFRAGRLLLKAFKLGVFADAHADHSVKTLLDPPSGLENFNTMLPALVDAVRDVLQRTGHVFLPVTMLPEDGWDCVFSIRKFAVLIGDAVTNSTPAQKANRKSTGPRRTNEELFKAALRKHHGYESDGSVLNVEPISTRGIEGLVGVSDSTAQRLLKKHFGSVEQYRNACFSGAIKPKLVVLLGDGLHAFGTSDLTGHDTEDNE